MPRHQAGQPGTSGVLNAVVGGEIDRGLVYTEEEGLSSAPIASPGQLDMPHATHAFSHPGDADFAIDSGDTRAAVF